MPDIAALVTPPLLLDSTGAPANGDIYTRVTATIEVSGGLVTPTQGHGVISLGQFKALDGTAFNLPVTPEGVAVEIFVELREERPEGRKKHTIRRTVAVPDDTTVTWGELIDVTPVIEGGDYIIPPWVAASLAASDTAIAAAAEAVAAAASVPTEATINESIATTVEAALLDFSQGERAYFQATFAPPSPADTPIITVVPYSVDAGMQLIAPTRTAPSGPVDMAGDPSFAYDGMLTFPAHAAVPASYVETDYLPNGSAQNARYQMRVQTVTSPIETIAFRFRVVTTGLGFRIKVNGRWLSQEITRVTGLTTGSAYLVVLTFPTALSRTIEIETAGGTPWGGCVVELGATLTKPGAPANPLKVAVLGDSYSGGAGSPPDGAGRLEVWCNWVAKLMGATSFINFGVGGTGWVASGGGGTQPYADRNAAILSYAPDVLLVLGSINDGAAGTGVQAAVTSGLSALSSIPRIVVAGPPRAAYAANNDAVEAGTLAAGRTFVDGVAGVGGPWLTDADIGTDGAHPTFTATKRMGRLFYEAMQTAGQAKLPYVPTPIFSDNFNRADASTLGTGWTTLNGTAGIVGNQAGPLTASTAQYNYFTAAADGEFTGTFADVGATLNAGVMVRFNPNSGASFIELAGISSVWTLRKRVASTTTVIQSSAVTPADGDTFRIRIEGTSIKVWVNGALLFDVVETDNLTNSLAGFFGSSTRLDSRFDNFSFSPL